MTIASIALTHFSQLANSQLGYSHTLKKAGKAAQSQAKRSEKWMESESPIVAEELNTSDATRTTNAAGQPVEATEALLAMNATYHPSL